MAENTSKPSSLYDHYEFLTVPQKAAVEFAWRAQHQDQEPRLDQLRDFGERAIQADALQTMIKAYDRHLDEKWADHRHLLRDEVTHPTGFMDFSLAAREAVWGEHKKRTDAFVPDGNVYHPHLDSDTSYRIQKARFSNTQSHAILTDPELVERITEEYKRDVDAGRPATLQPQAVASSGSPPHASHGDDGDDDDLAAETAAREERAADREAIVSERAAGSSAPETSWAGKARKKTSGAAVPVIH